jgi:hypothetical protein
MKINFNLYGAHIFLIAVTKHILMKLIAENDSLSVYAQKSVGRMQKLS